VTTLLILSDLLQGCSNKSDTVYIQQYCYNLGSSTLWHSCYIMTVSDLLEQPCNKSDNAIKLVASCYRLVPNLLQQLGTSSANTTCRQLVNRFVTTCFQTCNNLCVNLCVFTCVACVLLRVYTSCYKSANKLLQICSQAVNKLSSHCLFPVVATSLKQAVNNL
jgi:hypothetical protein